MFDWTRNFLFCAALFFLIPGFSSSVEQKMEIVGLEGSLSGGDEKGCLLPSPSQNFTLKNYEGFWYEIGKIQTKGGAFFEKDCVCTGLDVEIKDMKSGDSDAVNCCRKEKVDAPWTNATASLEEMDPPGHWKESFSKYAPSVDYTVILMDEEGSYAVEYDCGTSLGVTNYCIHILSKTPTMKKDLFNSLLNQALDMGLNTQELEVQMTIQEGCW